MYFVICIYIYTKTHEEVFKQRESKICEHKKVMGRKFEKECDI